MGTDPQSKTCWKSTEAACPIEILREETRRGMSRLKLKMEEEEIVSIHADRGKRYEKMEQKPSEGGNSEERHQTSASRTIVVREDLLRTNRGGL